MTKDTLTKMHMRIVCINCGKEKIKLGNRNQFAGMNCDVCNSPTTCEVFEGINDDREIKQHCLRIYFIDGTSATEDVNLSKREILARLDRPFLSLEDGVSYNTRHIKKVYISEIS